MQKILVLLPLLYVLAGCGSSISLGPELIADMKSCRDQGGSWNMGECTLPDEDGYSGIDIIGQTPATEEDTTGASAE